MYIHSDVYIKQTRDLSKEILINRYKYFYFNYFYHIVVYCRLLSYCVLKLSFLFIQQVVSTSRMF